ncbi:MAG: phosphodiester glycosidase family protein [Opitutales bacterium]|nr:phosphodiester glycosidase family protein [Opitutales bacterium]
MKSAQRSTRPILRRLRRCLVVAAVVTGVAAVTVALFFARRAVLEPGETADTEVFPGITYRMEQIAGRGSPFAHSVTVDMNHPGVRVSVSNPDTEAERPFRLAPAEWKLRRGGYAVLLNGARYKPAGYMNSLPGRAVESVELVVGDGAAAGHRSISHLIGWDAEGRLLVPTNRPAPEEAVADAAHGIGLLSLLIRGGEIDPDAADPYFAERVINRTFIGIDPEAGILMLFAFAKAQEFEAARYVRDRGAVYGGQLDSGTSSHLILGRGADGLPAYSGLRGWRPIASYIAVESVQTP